MKTTKRYLIAALSLALLTQPALSDGTLVLTDAGYQIMTISQNGATLTPVVPLDDVLDKRTNAPKPPAGDDDTNPTPTGRVAEVVNLSRVVSDKEGAMGWAATCRTIGDSLGTSSLPEDQWTRMSKVVLTGVESKHRKAWETWLAGVNRLAAGNFDKAFFKDVDAGLVRAYSLDTAQLDTAIAAASNEETAEQAGLPETMAWIIQLVTFILDMLKQFGVI